MANTQTTVPLFVANQVLTAAQQNTSAGTGVPVFATTVTRDAAFGGSNKVLAEGQLCYIEASDIVQYYTGAAWATVGPTASGLTLVSATTIGTAASSVPVSNCFSASYDAYKIVVSGGAGSGANGNLALSLGASATGYYASVSGLVYATGAAIAYAISNNSSFTRAGSATTNGINMVCDLNNPFLAKYTYISGQVAYTDEGGSLNGVHEVATSYTGFTITPSSGTLTGGTVRVYGYSNS